VRVVSDHLGPLHAETDRRDNAIAIDLDQPGDGEPLGLDEVLGVRPLPPGSYEVELVVRGERLKRSVNVRPAAGRPVGH
jgi:hypothetical protein